jgi:TonB family protein
MPSTRGLSIAHQGDEIVKQSFAVAAIATLAGTSLIHAVAEDIPATSSPSASAPLCKTPEPSKSTHLAPEVLATSVARFMQLCTDSNGGLVFGGDSRWANRLKIPGKFRYERDFEKFVPAGAMLGYNKQVIVSYVVELDGRTSLVAVIGSSGDPAVDKGAVQFVKNFSYGSPAYLDSTPVRFYTSMRLHH